MRRKKKKPNTMLLVTSVLAIGVILLAIRSAYRCKRALSSSAEPAAFTETAEPVDIRTETAAEKKEQQKHDMLADVYASLVKQYMEAVPGTCTWGFCLYPDEVTYQTESRAVPSASVIKIFIMEYVFSGLQNGKFAWESPIEGQTVQSLLEAMITVSDNTATNVFIDYFGMESLNDFFRRQGYAQTRLERRMLDTDAMAAGKDNYTSVEDVMRFLQKLYRGRQNFPYKDMLDIMKRQQVATKIRRDMPPSVQIANKTGELHNVENDVGIIFGEKTDFAIVFLCSRLEDTAAARDAIAGAANAVCRKWCGGKEGEAD